MFNPKSKLELILDQRFATTAGSRSVNEMIDKKRPTVFMAYPMDFTSVCTRQLCNYRDHWEQLSALPCQWWGINRGDIDTHKRFKAEKELPFNLISDPPGTLLKALNLSGMFSPKRGFTVVAPNYKILATSTIFPLFYRGYDQVIEFLEPLLFPKKAEAEGVEK